MSMIVGGYEFPGGTDELHASLWCFAHGGFEADERYGHLKRAIDLAFNCEGSVRNVVWNEWTERILRSCVGDWRRKRFVGFAGCSSSGKSDTVALYILMEYWSRPADTYGLILSTTKDSARRRIWRSMTQFFGQGQRMGCPGKLNDSLGQIKGVDRLGRLTGNSGIYLMAAGDKDSEAACSSIMGIKNANVLVAADEHPDLGDGILKTAAENLTVNDRVFFAGLGNPNLLTDGFAELCCPLKGWKSVTEENEEWETKYGMCYRFDAEKSPRIQHPELVDGNEKHLYHWQPDKEYCERVAVARGGIKSRGYYRFVRAFWLADGSANTIYSENEILNSGAMEEREPEWDSHPETLSALDPAFTRGGDRCMSMIAKLGKVKGRDHLHLCWEKTLSEDITNKTETFSFSMVRQWRQYSEDFGVKPVNAIMDNTGAGIPFGHIVDEKWSPAVQKVNFKAKASDRRIVFRGEECEYFNKNSELWIQPKEFIRSGQITGISKMLMAELVSREFHPKEGRQVRVEDKEEAKKRNNGNSPDIADAFLMIVEKAITMGKFHSEVVKKIVGTQDGVWKKLQKKFVISTTKGKKLRI